MRPSCHSVIPMSARRLAGPGRQQVGPDLLAQPPQPLQQRRLTEPVSIHQDGVDGISSAGMG